MNTLADRIWMMEHAAFTDLMSLWRAQAPPHGAQAARPDEPKSPVQVLEGGIAVVGIAGPLTKAGMFSFWTGQQIGTSTMRVRQAINAAANDPNISAILLHIDSPGGSVSGTADAAEAVFNARKRKRVYAYVEDMGASGAYWLASQAEKVFANSTAIIGSIGTYTVLYDFSKMAEAEGVKVHVVSTGPYKGAGVPGSEITDGQLAQFQKEINALNDLFLAGVARGRSMSADAVKAVADGRVMIGAQAKAAGLIDGVQGLEETIRQLRELPSTGAMRFQNADGAVPGARNRYSSLTGATR